MKNNLNLFKILMLILITLFLNIILIKNSTFSFENQFIYYTVKKHDRLEIVLKRNKLFPIYGKNGSLEKFLILNPAKSKARGNRIQPGETILLPTKESLQNFVKVTEPEEKNYGNKKIKITNHTIIREEKFLLYKVKKGDMISMLLYKYKVFPIYKKNGSLHKTLFLNPKKIKTKGDLIFPNEYIILPVPDNYIQEIINFLPENEKSSIIDLNDQNIFDKPESQGKEEIIRDAYKNIEDYYNYFNFKDVDNEKITPVIKKKKLPIPQAPNNLIAVLENKTIILSWDPIEQEDITYEIYRSQKSKSDYTLIQDNINEVEFSDRNINSGTIYYYVVVAKNSSGKSIYSNEVAIQSHAEWHLPTSLRLLTTVKYLKNSEYLVAQNRYSSFQSAASPSISLYQITNWTDQFITYLGGGLLYLNYLESPVYDDQNMKFGLIHLSMGLEYTTTIRLLLKGDLTLNQDIIYKMEGYNSLVDKKITSLNPKLTIGYKLFELGSLQAQLEGSYIFTAPLNYKPILPTHGYEAAFKLSQQNSAFYIGSKFFYSQRSLNTPIVKSTITEFGLTVDITIELGER
ncbi:MAG: hypothetical protein DCC88_09650 [Spirobacillus cienkowskii]|uniref:Fibronectin type-III domain-containing protein n=1 Tax=Spirobacillus cienkowskii TaxID=495820 RepID=A0A369KWI2_9BACT|nr:MAG: hypothetical protein DCC88_09650 [Spirobacillus cienkowskii]